jgi:hypothetical protein
LCGAAALIGCAQEPPATLVDVPVASFEVTVGISAETAFLNGLARFAAANGLEWWTDTQASEIGVRRVFEMRRRDLRIFGSNGVRDYGGDIPVRPDGYPDIEIDPALFRVHLYQGAVEPNRATLNQIHAAFVQTFGSVGGIDVAELSFR